LKTSTWATPSSRTRPQAGNQQKLSKPACAATSSGSFDVAVFYNKYRDFIDEDAVVGTVEQFQAVNIKHATIKGAEAKVA
jgi:outer membrane cobalamin receptor